MATLGEKYGLMGSGTLGNALLTRVRQDLLKCGVAMSDRIKLRRSVVTIASTEYSIYQSRSTAVIVTTELMNDSLYEFTQVTRVEGGKNHGWKNFEGTRHNSGGYIDYRKPEYQYCHTGVNDSICNGKPFTGESVTGG